MPREPVVVRHADHGPGVICRPALGYGLCEPLRPVTGPGWYRAGKNGLERVAGLEELPDDISDVPPLVELVKVELDGVLIEEPLW